MTRKGQPGLERPVSTPRGFTLIEVMIVVAIVAILGAIAVPAYSRYVTRSKLSEAFSLLSSLGIAAQQYYQDNRSYLVTAGATTTCPMAVPGHKNFAFSCSSVSHSTITINATGTADDLKRGQPIIFTLNQDGDRATTQVPNGWVANSGACWVRTQTGDCS